jgi:branched-chain amino acid transport system permease protein
VALPGLTTYFEETFKGDQGIFVPFPGPPESIAATVSLQRWQALLALLCAVLTMFLFANLKRSAVGRSFAAVRDNEVAAQLCGLSVGREKVLAFALSSAAAGLGGGVFAVWLGTASPSAFDLVLSLALLAAIVIGGLGSLAGVVWGSLVVIYLGELITERIEALQISEDAASRLYDNLPTAVYGLLLIVVMLAVPGGIQGQLLRLRGRLPRRSAHPTGGH